MNKTVLAICAGAATLVAASMLGVASAEGPSTTLTGRTVSVEGVGVVPIGVRDDAATATATYREAMAKALADGQEKASLLASKGGAVLDALQSVVEDGGYIECSGTSNPYAEYEGEQPDFGSGPRVGVAPESAAAAPGAPAHVNHRPKTHRRTKAKTASAAACTLTADVGVVYAIG